jgi:transglycosylase-like protein with SLT domain
VYFMTTRSSTASGGYFFPASVLIALAVLLATLFVMLQSANRPFFPSTNSHGIAKAPFFRGVVYLPQFRFLPFFGGAAPDAEMEESRMPPAERIDRWEPFITEASQRFSIPKKWIRTIINIESGGRTMLLGRPITSGAGAMGVMQLMSDTYNDMSTRNGLGSDPYNVHDNILAGTAYLRELFNRYGYPRVFEAYNAGPGVLEAHIQHRIRLPEETVNYVRMAVIGTGSPAEAQKAVAEAVSRPPVKARAVAVKSIQKLTVAKLALKKAAASAQQPAHFAGARQIDVAAAKPVHAMVRTAHTATAAQVKNHVAAA